jgi:hypothetical protein
MTKPEKCTLAMGIYKFYPVYSIYIHSVNTDYYAVNSVHSYRSIGKNYFGLIPIFVMVIVNNNYCYVEIIIT